ncbi:MAG: methionyl-tRNA formyltransferase [Lachnospiraceae bacterium]|nr:methionyl-tRNA formyltransferase [Lachnospiraceae bacterium]
MKILFMGTPDFAEHILAAICDSKEHEVVAAVTQPDRPKGRSGTLVASPVKEYASSHGIRVLQPVKIRQSEEIKKLREIDADIYVVAAFGQILPPEVLSIPKKGCVNVHASLLPEYRGAAPIQRAIMDGRKVTGVTVQQMNEGVDTGDIISTVEVAIDPDETGESLFDKLKEAGAQLIVRTLRDIESAEASFTPQDESKATYAGMLKKEMGLIDFTKTADEIERLVRAFSPWPGTYTYLGKKMLKIKKCRVVPGGGKPGEVISVSKDEIAVACAENALAVTVVQLEGKREMTVHDFLLGSSIKTGTMLGNTAQ